MHCYVTLGVKNGDRVVMKGLDECTAFVYEKALYVPYTRFSGTFYEDGEPDISAEDVVSVRAWIGSNEIHHGLADEIRIERTGRGHSIRVYSRGYTLLLAQNQPYPRINSNVTLKTLCENNLSSPYISYEDPTPVVGNIYVNEGSTVWEAAIAYCIKASGYFPFIKGKNMVRMTAGTQRTVDYSGAVMLSQVSAVGNVMRQYLAPLQAGLVSDVDAAVAEFRTKVTDAGLEACREGFQEQWADYCAEYNYQ